MLLSDDPRTMAMLAMGTSLLQAGGPSTQRTSFGSALGQGLQSGMSSFLATQKAAEDKKLRDMQVKVAQGQVDDSTRKQAFFNRIAQMQNPGAQPQPGPMQAGAQPASFGNMPPGLLDDGRMKPRPGLGLLDMIASDPQLAAGAAEFAPHLVKPQTATDRTKVVGNSLVDSATGQPIYTAPEKPQGPESAIGKLADDLRSGRITQAQYDQGVAAMSRPLAQMTSNMPPEENEEQKMVGRYYGEKYAGMQDAGTKATGGIARLERLDQLLDQVNTGAFAENVVGFKKAAKAAGVDLDAMGVRDDVAPAEAAKALANEMALELRNPAGGAGMPGAMSDGDRRMLESMTPSLNQTPEGRKLLIDARKRMYRREQDVARQARAYRAKNGKLDERFFDELAAWSEKNPMFSNEDMSKAETARLPMFNSAAEVDAAVAAGKLAPGARFRIPGSDTPRVVPAR